MQELACWTDCVIASLLLLPVVNRLLHCRSSIAVFARELGFKLPFKMADLRRLKRQRCPKPAEDGVTLSNGMGRALTIFA